MDSPVATNNDHPTVAGLESLDGGRMWVDRRFREPLRRAGLDRFDAVMATTQGRCIRALADRENWRLELHDGHRGPRGLYLKKHHVRSLGSWIRAAVGAPPPTTAGRVEAQNAGRLGLAGVEVMSLVGYGERLRRDGLVESFVLTEELTGYTPLDHFLMRRFPPLPEQGQRRRDPDLTALIRRIADIARRFHEAGYNHRDFYCGHFFVREPAPGRFDVKLIDLQRVQYRRRLRRRWIAKDLAQLAWSAHRHWISCTQKMAFIRHYLGVRKLRPGDKRLVRRVLAKRRRMERRLGYGP